MTSVVVVARSEQLRIGAKVLLESAGFDINRTVATLGQLPMLSNSFDVIVFDGSLEPIGDFAAHRVRLVVVLPETVSDTELGRLALVRPAAIVGRSGSADDLVAAVRSVRDGDSWVAPDIGARLIALVDRRRLVQSSAAALTGRERQVLTGIAAGRANYEIATALHLTVRTVKYHVSNLLAKLGARDRAHAVALGYGLALEEWPDGQGRDCPQDTCFA